VASPLAAVAPDDAVQGFKNAAVDWRFLTRLVVRQSAAGRCQFFSINGNQ
jgi:hypothetical protein